MSQPHNKARYGEVWPASRITESLEVLQVLREHVVLSGGWAWHFMSPEGHTELKHAHDHKDIDVFVHPEKVWEVLPMLTGMGFEKARTKYDRLDSAEDFRRYEKTVPRAYDRALRLTIDFFVNDVPSIEVRGFRVVEPKTLLGFYSNIHSSDKCFAVMAASRMVAKGIDPVGSPELVAIPT